MLLSRVFVWILVTILWVFQASDLLAQKKKYYPLFDQELTKKEVKERYRAFAEEQKAQGFNAKEWRKVNRAEKKARKEMMKTQSFQVQVDSIILSPEANDWESVRFANGTYKDLSGEAFSGRLISYYEDGTARLEAVVIQGKLNGQASEYFPNGQLKIQRNYVQGAMTGIVEEYFANGELKLKGTITGINSHGGDQIEDVVVGYYKNETYRTKKMKQARIQFINQEGRTPRRNEALDLEIQSGYMLFDRSGLTGEKVYTPDSRRIDVPTDNGKE